MLTRETMTGPWAGLPVAWTADDRFDEDVYRTDVRRCCAAGVPGVYTGGTTGEFYAMEFEEFQAVVRATVEECRKYAVPVMIGCSATSTRGARRRAAFAAEIGADAIQAALPFWLEVADPQVVPFFAAVAEAAGGLAFSIYETRRARRTLTLDQHRAIRDAVPNYLMVKANAGTLGTTPDGAAALSEFVNVFVGESLWAALGPAGVRGGCSAMVYWNPPLVLDLWRHVARQNWQAVEQWRDRIQKLHEFLAQTFGPKGFTDTAYDRLGGRSTGFLQTSLRCRAPYPSPTEEDVAAFRSWCGIYFPELLAISGGTD